MMDRDMTIEDYNNLKEQQDGKCKICKCSKSLVIDHDHKTGKVRSLLCHRCNSGLGFFDDNPKFLESASTYLK